ncbi:hypothetical protein FHS85_004798 [Rhodoligotrophos appendicifer]|uniref:hypothetical protein n=1 Tax=Rhodoligotrophos appendicifer TaxID=987056 RepID=UPI001184E519|nr:hypothetical protein [Rhodoligotrophos appendicifer]
MRVVADLENKYPAPSVHVERAVSARVLAAAGVYAGGFEDFLKKRYPNDQLSAAVFDRANVLPAFTTSQTVIVQSAFKSFLTSLVPLSAAAELIRRGVQVDIGRDASAAYPARSGAPTAAPWVGEGEPIPVVTRAVTSVTVGPARKIALISVITRELARRADGEAVVTQLLREDVAAGLDAGYFSTAAGSASAHAGLLNGVSPLTATSGGDYIAMQADLAALAAAVAANGSGQVVFIVSPTNAAILPIKVPDIASGITVLPSSAVSDTRVIAVDPISILHFTDPEPEIDISKHATVHMSNVPLEIVSDTGPTIADPVRSTFQTDALAIRLLADIAFSKRRSGAVAYMDDVDWSPT